MRDYNTANLDIVMDDSNSKYQIISFKGELDKLGLEKVQNAIDAAIDVIQPDLMIFDFNDLDFINSESIGFLLTVHTRLIKKNKKLAIINAKSHVKDVLNVIGITKLIGCYDNIGDLESLLKP